MTPAGRGAAADVGGAVGRTAAADGGGAVGRTAAVDGGGAAGRTAAVGRWRERVRALSRGLDEFYRAPYRRTLARAHRDEEDLFMMLVLGEALGVPNPSAGATLELLPHMLERLHEWHLRQGLDSSPIDSVSCC